MQITLFIFTIYLHYVVNYSILQSYIVVRNPSTNRKLNMPVRQVVGVVREHVKCLARQAGVDVQRANAEAGNRGAARVAAYRCG